ncbi:MAG: hypothetical protein FJ267_16840, partial [Planctomycetes bacterium]|nr:hypothetical protein [Planctomycetota bacterium]
MANAISVFENSFSSPGKITLLACAVASLSSSPETHRFLASPETVSFLFSLHAEQSEPVLYEASLALSRLTQSPDLAGVFATKEVLHLLLQLGSSTSTALRTNVLRVVANISEVDRSSPLFGGSLELCELLAVAVESVTRNDALLVFRRAFLTREEALAFALRLPDFASSDSANLAVAKALRNTFRKGDEEDGYFDWRLLDSIEKLWRKGHADIFVLGQVVCESVLNVAALCKEQHDDGAASWQRLFQLGLTVWNACRSLTQSSVMSSQQQATMTFVGQTVVCVALVTCVRDTPEDDDGSSDCAAVIECVSRACDDTNHTAQAFITVASIWLKKAPESRDLAFPEICQFFTQLRARATAESLIVAVSKLAIACSGFP